MHVLITGGAGFIGSHLVELHLARGDQVHVVDDLSTGDPANLERFRDHPALRLDEADVLTWDLLERSATWADRIYHLAAVVGVYRVLEQPTKVLAVNIAGCERLLRAVASAGWRPQVLIASSSEVYGHDHEGPLEEDLDLTVSTRTGTRWNYSVSKIADEALGLSYARRHGIPVAIARLFNTIGPRQSGRYGMVVPRFVEQALAGHPLTVFGDGSQTRSFCDVRDTVVMLDRLAAMASTDGLVCNVGNDREIAIDDLARLVIERAGSSSGIEHIPYVKAYGEAFEDVRRRRPALARIRGLTRYRNRHALEDTIDDLIRDRRESEGEQPRGDCTVVRHQSKHVA